MLALFLRSVGLHIVWFVRSIWPGAHTGAPLGLRRVLFLVLLYPCFLGLQLIHWLGLLCDELIFRGYRKVEVREPVFVSGVPRSGTTFVHRTLATEDCFTTVTTWEALFAPSITGRKIVRALASVDRALGGFAKRGLTTMTGRMTASLDDIHAVGLGAPEEDYHWLLPAGGCFILFLAFPFAPELRGLADFDSLPKATQKRLLNFYRRCIQRHLYCAPSNARFLSKNAAFGSWLPALRHTFPDASFLVCVREPKSALSSQLSSLGAARGLFGTDPQEPSIARAFREIYATGYAAIRRFLDEKGGEGVRVIDQDDLRLHGAIVLERALDSVFSEVPENLLARVRSLPPEHQSAHHHETGGIPGELNEIEVCLQPEYEKILGSPQRVTLNEP